MQLAEEGVLNVDDPVEKRIRKILFNDLSIENKRSHIIDLTHIEKSKKIKILGIIGYNDCLVNLTGWKTK